MNRSNYGATSEIISQITDAQQLTAMLKNPQYAGFTNIIIARLTEIKRLQGAAQGAAPAAPTVAQQAVQPQQQPQPQPQAMARGGIVAFKDGGKVKKDEAKRLDGYKYKQDEYAPLQPKEISREINLAEPKGPDISDITADRPPVGIRGFAGGSAGEAIRAMQRYGSPEEEYSEEPVYGRSSGPVSAEHQGMEHGVSGPRWQNPFRMRDAYQANLDAAVAASRAGAGRTKALSNTAANTLAPGAAPGQKDTPLPPLSPVAERDFGYPSMGGVASFSMRNSGGDRPARPLAGYMSELRDAMGPNTSAEEARAELKQQKKGALGNALMYAGLGMARGASTHPQHGILGNLATGATEGLTSYDKQEQERQQQLRDLGKIERAERLGLVNAGVTERGQDVRADRQENLQRMGLGLQAQSLKGPALLEAAIRKRAVDLANQARAVGVQKPYSEYHLQATREYSSPLGIASMRADTARQTQATQVFNNAEKVQPGSGRRAVQMWEAQGAPMDGGGGAGKNYGALE